MKKRKTPIVTLILMLIFPAGIMAQQPAWVDYAKRNSMYPQSDYLTGFVSAHNTNNEDPGKLMDKYEEMAKSKVIQSIQVSIETNNSLTLSNVNGKSGEEFRSKSVSFSSATITGLKAERYYDRKKNDVYAFAYVSKKELAWYNRKLITSNLEKIKQKLAEGREYLALDDKQNALKSFYEGMPLLAEAEQAQWLLLAVNREQFVSDDLKKIRDAKIELNKEISRLQQSKELNMSETAYFIAYGLFIQLGKPEIPLDVEPCTYENTGLASDFSDKWNTEIRNALVKTGNYKIQERSNAGGNVVKVKGNYWVEGDQLRIHVQALKNNKLDAAAEGAIPVSWLKAEKINYVPVQVEKIQKLKNVKLQAIGAPDNVKIGRQSEKPMEVRVLMERNGMTVPMENVPLVFSTGNGKAITRGISNSNGVVSAYFPPVHLPEGKTEILAQIDLAVYADIDTNSAFYLTAVKNNPVTPAVFTIQLNPQTYYVKSDESIDRRPVDIKTIEPAIKNRLVDKGYHFVNGKPDADYVIFIKAATTTGSGYQGIYYSYVDATLSVVDAATGDEIFKTSVEQVKGAGGNSKKAGKKAMSLASEKLTDKLMAFLEGR